MDWSELEAAYERYHQQLYRYCFSIVGNAEDAQDALQNAMLKAVRALPGEQREIQLKPWLYRIAHNESIELLRRRRDRVPLGPDLASPVGELAETATQRDRLRRLLGDLEHLPERQRGALVMRELDGLGFEQIAEAFETSPAVARQTVYEARLSLRQLEAGREMSCEKVMRELSDADGRITRRRDIQSHLRDCAECREFGESIATRRRDLAAIAPLPAAASSALLHSLLGGGNVGASLGGGVAAGAGKTALGSVAVKSAATVAVVAVLGVSIADRSHLVDVSGSHGGDSNPGRAAGSTPSEPSAQADAGVPAAGVLRSGDRTAPSSALGGNRGRDHQPAATTGAGDGKSGSSARNDGSSAAAHGPAAKELPAASSHGQETAARHGGGRAQAGSKAGGAAKSHSNANSHAPSEPPGRSKGDTAPPGQSKAPGRSGQAGAGSESPGGSHAHTGGGSSQNTRPSPPPSPGPPQGVGPDNSSKAPLQPSETP
jgi:RNA polymerase sigma factor (sigma-70 family)